MSNKTDLRRELPNASVSDAIVTDTLNSNGEVQPKRAVTAGSGGHGDRPRDGEGDGERDIDAQHQREGAGGARKDVDGRGSSAQRQREDAGSARYEGDGESDSDAQRQREGARSARDIVGGRGSSAQCQRDDAGSARDEGDRERDSSESEGETPNPTHDQGESGAQTRLPMLLQTGKPCGTVCVCDGVLGLRMFDVQREPLSNFFLYGIELHKYQIY